MVEADVTAKNRERCARARTRGEARAHDLSAVVEALRPWRGSHRPEVWWGRVDGDSAEGCARIAAGVRVRYWVDRGFSGWRRVVLAFAGCGRVRSGFGRACVRESAVRCGTGRRWTDAVE